ncbi:hypothetical protein [Paenisporosarcina sp. TG20]|uniref:hypothetical protein n=1 Tax=Paenisporosarcina sp. TG20 TaxID=1211706 RepID=UPI00030B7D71|nr:hypothetical protein [Paenisporosarcina sp. TG20]
MLDKKFEKFKRDNFESFSFTRMIRTPNLEVFWIRGVNDASNFDEHWDGRLIEVLGYLVIYSDKQINKLVNYIYLIEDENKNYQDIIRNTKMFASEICTYTELFDMNNFIIQKTDVYQTVHAYHEIVDFIKKIVNQDIPENVLDE